MIAKKFDLLIRGGRIYDPVQKIDMIGDVGISYPNIAEIIDPKTETDRVCATNIVDASGLMVVPGLVELHSHFFPTLSFAMTKPEEAFRDGIVAITDCGSSGYKEFPYFRQNIMDPSPMVTNACIYATSAGQNDDENEFGLPGFVDKKMMVRMINMHKDVILGVKVLFSKNKCNNLEMLQIARETCRETGTRLFVHVTNANFTFPEYIKYFDEGDVVVHCYHGRGNCLINPDTGKLYDEVWEARKRGVLFDAARGTINWDYSVCRQAFSEGFYPDFITSDMTALTSMPNTCQLTTYMTELMALGMPFADILKKVTYDAAAVMKGVRTGIAVGQPANLTLLRFADRKQTYRDSRKEEFTVDQVIEPVATILKGKVVYDARVSGNWR